MFPLAPPSFTYGPVVAIEAADKPGMWYRLCRNSDTRLWSCNCSYSEPAQDPTLTTCVHIAWIYALLNGRTMQKFRNAIMPLQPTHPLIERINQRWNVLSGSWTMRQLRMPIDTVAYNIAIVELLADDELRAVGVIAYLPDTPLSAAEILDAAAQWIGCSIAVHLMQRRRTHLRTPPSPSANERQARAEQMLQRLLGPTDYTQLQHMGYLDIPSRVYADERRVYRLVRDPYHESERQLRVYESSNYVYDLCIIRGEAASEAEFLGSLLVQLLFDEKKLLDQLDLGNKMPAWSDSDIGRV